MAAKVANAKRSSLAGNALSVLVRGCPSANFPASFAPAREALGYALARSGCRLFGDTAEIAVTWSGPRA